MVARVAIFSSMSIVRPAAGAADIESARRLFREYAAALGVNLGFQNFESEVATLPGPYAPPAGRLLLAEAEAEVAGCVAVRPLEPGACELKRLYVRPEFRGQGLGVLLAQGALEQARQAGYDLIRLDTLPTMTAAQTLYRRLGFREVPASYPTPVAGTVFFELPLERQRSA